MVNQLQRIGLPPNSSLEQKRLSLDLAGIIIAWEKRRRSAPVTKPPVSWAFVANRGARRQRNMMAGIALNMPCRLFGNSPSQHACGSYDVPHKRGLVLFWKPGVVACRPRVDELALTGKRRGHRCRGAFAQARPRRGDSTGADRRAPGEAAEDVVAVLSPSIAAAGPNRRCGLHHMPSSRLTSYPNIYHSCPFIPMLEGGACGSELGLSLTYMSSLPSCYGLQG